ncbi:hypothetical protein GHV40_04795 [Devosia sp. D6-9]|nr:hypothetical protein GHV40_04795 [Devosia sp. D6-9]
METDTRKAASVIDGKQMLKELVDAVARSSWFEAGTLLTALEAGAPLPDQDGTWLNAAVRASRQNMNMLRKMQRAARFVEGLDEPPLREELKARPLSHVEVIARATTLDPAQGRALLENYHKAGLNFSYRQLLAFYEKIRAANLTTPEVLGRKTKGTAAEFRRICLDIIGGPQMLPLYADICMRPPEAISTRIWKGGHQLASPYATVRRLPANQLRWDRRPENGPSAPAPLMGVDGVECYMRYDTDPSDVASKRLLLAASEASMFDVFWVVLPDDPPSQKPDLYAQLFEMLDVPNLGIVLVDPERKSITSWLAPKGNPVPDRRHLWDDWSRQYLAKTPSRRTR